MKHVIQRPGGTPYITLWEEAGRLNLQLHRADTQPIIHLDIKCLTELIDALIFVERELELPENNEP